jgi:hypothetical protein
VKRALIILALAGSACDDAPVQEFEDVRYDADAAPADAGDAAAISIDGGLDASPVVDASAVDAALDGGFVDEVDAALDERDASALPYARVVSSFAPGTNAGFGQNRYPDIVLGPPKGKGNNAGSLDVLTLGIGGEIVLDFGTRSIVDGPGADFIVFENAFYAGGSSQAAVFAELGEVSVSNDLTTWLTFSCSLTPTSPGVYPGCAGWTPTQLYDPFEVLPLDPAKTGGDAFDLATISAMSARYVRVRDLATSGQGSTAGFDLDAIGVIHTAPAP